jgi:hypothetical protein
MKVIGQSWNQIPILVRGGGKAMQQNDLGVCGIAGFPLRNLQSIDLDGLVCHRSGVDGRREFWLHSISPCVGAHFEPRSRKAGCVTHRPIIAGHGINRARLFSAQRVLVS